MVKLDVQIHITMLALFFCQQTIGSKEACAPAVHITPKDLLVVEKAKERAKQVCTGVFEGTVNPEEGHANLLKCVGHENRIYNILNASSSQEELSASNYVDIAWLIQKAAAIIVSFIIAFAWLICCWTCCPCCRRCRCCSKERRTGKAVKVFGIIFAGAIGVGICAAAILALEGASKTVDGLHNFACTSASFLDSTLGGQQDPHFIGMNPMLGSFDRMSKSLQNKSYFMTQAERHLEATIPLAAALKEAFETLRLMQDMLTIKNNQFPSTSWNFDQRAGSVPYHQCELCQHLQEPLSKILSTLDNSSPNSLVKARSEVLTQFGSGRRAELQCDMQTATMPVREVINMIRDKVEWFIDDNAFGRVAGNRRTLFALFIVAVLLGVLLIACTCSSAACFTFKEKLEIETSNPYNFWVYRIAAVSWCSAFGYAILFLLLGGSLAALSVPLSGLCLVMEDLNSTTISDMYLALGLDNQTMAPGTDNWEMAMGVVDQCFSPAQQNASGNIMEIMFLNEQSSQTTLHDRLLNSFADPLDEQFRQIDAANIGPLATLPTVTKLVNVLRANPVNHFITPVPNISKSPQFGGLSTDDRGAAGLSVGFRTSASCKNHTIINGMEPLIAGQTMIGFETFVSRLTKYGYTKGGSSCLPENFYCTIGTMNEEPGCYSASNFLTLQTRIMSPTLKNFRCDIFTQPNSNEDCDPAELTKSIDGSWSGSCAKTSCSDPRDTATCKTTLERKTKECNLNEFTQYVERYADRIPKVLDRVESTTEALENEIKVELRNLVNTEFQEPIRSLVNGTNCGFLNTLYKDMVAGLCYQGAWGIQSLGHSYTAMAGLAVATIPLSYAIWRRAIDNANEWGKDKFDGVDGI